MTDLKEPVIAEALAIIDAGLGGLTDRNLVSSNEITNLLLDVRVLLSEQITFEDLSDLQTTTPSED